MTTEKKAAPKAPAAKATDPMTRELAAVKAMKAAAPKAAPAKAGEVGKCRGRWSKCGGTEPAVSAKWHLGAKCTAEYRAMKKAEAAAKPKAAPAKAASKVTPLAARKPPAQRREPVARVPAAAMVAPEVSITKS